MNHRGVGWVEKAALSSALGESEGNAQAGQLAVPSGRRGTRRGPEKLLRKQARTPRVSARGWGCPWNYVRRPRQALPAWAG